MTLRECAIVMAHTGICMLQGENLKYFYDYVGELIGEPVYTHDIANNADAIKAKSKEDFLKLCESAENKEKYRWHDLRKDKDDLPEDDILVEVGFENGHYNHSIYCHRDDTFGYRNISKVDLRSHVVKWRYIEGE